MRTPSFLKRPGPSSGRVRRNLAHTFGIGALVALLMASGVGVTFALWNSQAEATSSISGAKLELTTTFQDLDFTFANNSLRTTGTFTVTNTTVTNSSLPGTVAAQLSAPGDVALASTLGVAVWPQSVAPCTVSAAPGSAVTGTWNAVPLVTTSLAPGSSATFCVRVTGVERGVMGDGDGTMSISPTVSASLTMGNWNSGAITATATQTTTAIYPAVAPTIGSWQQIVNQQSLDCVDVHGNSTSTGTGVIDYPCKWGTGTDTYNQQWQFATSATVSGGTYFSLAPRHATALRVGIDGSSASALAEAKVQTGSTTQSQQWQPQYRAAGVFQLVNRNSGMCMTPHNTSTYGDLEYVQATCDSNRVDQTFAAHAPFAVPSMTLTCAPSINGGVTYSWTGGTVPGVVQFSASPNGGGTPVAVGSTVYSTGTFTLLPGQLSANGQYTLTATGGSTQLTTTTALWRSTASGTPSLSCAPPVPVIDSMGCQASGSDSSRIITCTISPAAVGTYTMQAATSVTSSGAGWNDIATTSSNQFVITGSGVSTLADGSYNIRVRDAAGNLLNNAWRISVGSVQFCSGWEIFGNCYGGGGWQTYKYPSNPTTSTPSFSCFNTGNNNNRRVSYSWDLEYPGELTFQVIRSGDPTFMVTAPPGSTAQAVSWTAPNGWSNNTYTVRAMHGGTQVGATEVDVASGNGNNKILRCAN